VAADAVGLRVIDISLPSNPTEVAYLDLGICPRGVAVSGDYAYVANYSTGLQVIDISDPEHPQTVDSCDTPGQAYSVVVSGNYAYVADYSSGLRVMDIFAPEHPTEVGHYDTPGEAYGVAVSAGYAYVADNNFGLQIYQNLLSGIEVKNKEGEKVLKVTQNLFLSTAEVELPGVKFPITLNVYDVTGRVREKTIIYNSSTVNIGADLAPGIYFVRVEGFAPAKITKLR
jgi:hypothetical protein